MARAGKDTARSAHAGDQGEKESPGVAGQGVEMTFLELDLLARQEFQQLREEFWQRRAERQAESGQASGDPVRRALETFLAWRGAK